jgi:hypothetical protein
VGESTLIDEPVDELETEPEAEPEDYANVGCPQTIKYLRMLVNQGLLVLTEFVPFSYYDISRKGRLRQP